MGRAKQSNAFEHAQNVPAYAQGLIRAFALHSYIL